MFKYYNHLSFHSPYYFLNNNREIELGENFKSICDKYPNERKIDLVSIIDFINKSYFLGDRTIVKGISRSPWMSRPTSDLLSWESSDVPSHYENVLSEDAIALELFKKICAEILEYVSESTKIGVLLSGGMDSRIVAGALDYLMKTGQISNITVVGLTWGDINSRDVRYAKEIAFRLKWQWKHYIVTPNDFLNNINEVSLSGCEFSPIHLHALPQIREDNNLEVILAGSYGDSIGRAEYSSIKVKNLKPIHSNFRNWSSIIKNGLYSKYSKFCKTDVEYYQNKYPQQKTYQQYEQDYQLHYMRRMLNPCMEAIGNKMQLCQVFTNPVVFGYMWQFNPKCRNNEIYKHILGYFYTKLDDIPWARTGIPYGAKSGVKDNFSKNNHSYNDLIRNDIYYEIEKLVLSDEIYQLGIFNMSSLKNILRLVKSVPHKSYFYTERLSWIASLSKAISAYNLKFDKTESNRINERITANIQVPMEFYLRKIYSEL